MMNRPNEEERLTMVVKNLFPIYHKCKGAAWILSPRSSWIRAQRAQHNEFVESGLKN